ncbi:MAG: DUF4262 domain-containing protein [Hyphomonas sp.]|nr:DUF4262 domain-containing protein [Hyphomonas sp.]
MALDPVLQPVADRVARDGWTKVMVGKPTSDPEARLIFTTTVGLQEMGIPELVVFGLSRALIDGFIEGTLEVLAQAGGWKGEPLELDGVVEDQPIALRQVHGDHINFVGSTNILVRQETGRAPLAGMVQVFWAGEDGRLPWDPQSTDKFPDQPRLDLPAPRPANGQ